MTIANVLSVTFAILGAIIAFSSFWLLLGALAPASVAAATLRMRHGPGRSFAAGLPLTLILIVGGVGLLQGGAPAKITGALMFGVGVLLSGLGLAALSRVIGERLPSPVDRERPWRAQVRGSLCLQFAWVLPFVGMPGIAALSIITACGAGFLGFLDARRAPAGPVEREATPVTGASDESDDPAQREAVALTGSGV